jgi:hypothetical protein
MLDKERLVAMLGLACVTVRVMIAQRVSIPFVPVTFNEYCPATSPALMPKIVEPQAQPVDVRMRLLGESVADGPNGVTFTLRVTFPTKPFTLAKLIVVCWL